MAKTCERCGEVIPWHDRFHDRYIKVEGTLCRSCYFESIKQDRDDGTGTAPTSDRKSIILTTETAHNLPIADRLGIVSAEYVIGMHIFRDIASAFRDVFGGRSQTMQQGLKEARTAALDELRAEALALGADAVVGIDLDYSEISGGGKSMLFLVASGTAVEPRRVCRR